MPYGLYISAEGAVAQSQRLEVISNNLANVDTVGFKRDLAILQARYAEAIERGEQIPGSGALEDIGGGIEMIATATDHSLGPLKQTGRPSDLALDAAGFFSVRKGNQNLLTRAGNFILNPNGEFTTSDGYPLLASDGTPLVVDPDLPWQFTNEGNLEQAGSVVEVAIVNPRSLGDLVKVGQNFYQSLAPVDPAPPEQRRVAPGFLEGSGVVATSEMMDMIETSRAYEANVSLIRGQDQIMGNLISRVLRASS
jgi:flagellar basal-body rod protein FlgF/flagellar basal-body rod protein FlgG